MSDYKKQHYVPKFYLRNFSIDEKEQGINLYNFSKDKMVLSASIKGQCQRHFYYGDDLVMEKGLGPIEGVIAKVISKIRAREVLSSVEKRLFALFIVIQQGRTQAAEKSVADFVEHFRAMEWSPEIADKRNKELGEFSKDIPRQNVLIHSRHAPILYDLKVITIIAGGDKRFITSDNPVVLANPVWKEIRGYGGFGLASSGLVIFVPLSPMEAVMLYDRNCFTVPLGGQRIVFADSRDVDFLNKWTVINCFNSVYFSDERDADCVSKILTESTSQKLDHSAVISEYEEVSSGHFVLGALPPEGAVAGSSLIHTFTRRIESPLRLSFAKKRTKLKFSNNDSAKGPQRYNSWANLVEKAEANLVGVSNIFEFLSRQSDLFTPEIGSYFE